MSAGCNDQRTLIEREEILTLLSEYPEKAVPDSWLDMLLRVGCLVGVV